MPLQFLPPAAYSDHSLPHYSGAAWAAVRAGCSCLGLELALGVPASLAVVQQEPAHCPTGIFQGRKDFVCPISPQHPDEALVE